MPVEIQRVQTKGKSPYHHEDNACYINREDKQDQIKEMFCKRCIMHGHTDKKCTKTGTAISIAQYLRTCSADKKQQILDAYRENRKAAHAQYLEAYERRKDLKKSFAVFSMTICLTLRMVMILKPNRPSRCFKWHESKWHRQIIPTWILGLLMTVIQVLKNQ